MDEYVCQTPPQLQPSPLLFSLPSYPLDFVITYSYSTQVCFHLIFSTLISLPFLSVCLLPYIFHSFYSYLSQFFPRHFPTNLQWRTKSHVSREEIISHCKLFPHLSEGEAGWSKRSGGGGGVKQRRRREVEEQV